MGYSLATPSMNTTTQKVGRRKILTVTVEALHLAVELARDRDGLRRGGLTRRLGEGGGHGESASGEAGGKDGSVLHIE